MSDGFLLAIPVFNEEQYVARVLDEAGRHCRQILVVDDGSTDRTPELLNEFTQSAVIDPYGGREATGERGNEATRHPSIRIIRHRQNIGYGKCLADAFDFAQNQGYDWLITMDCDLQHEPSRLPRFMAAAARDDADIISGTRYPEGRLVDASAPADRREINHRITRIINDKLGLQITDAFCGFKAYRVAGLARLQITVPGYAMPMQLWVQVARAGLRVGELPVPLIYHDPTRCFGGVLDDPAVRLEHYLEVLDTELAKGPSRRNDASRRCLSCR